MQYIGKRLHHRVKCDNQQGKTRQGDVNVTPGANDEAGALPSLQREHKMLGELQGLSSALKIGYLARVQLWHGRVKAGISVDRLQAICFEWLRFTRTQSLNIVLQLEDAFFDGSSDADAIGAGITGDGMRLPCIEQATGNARQH